MKIGQWTQSMQCPCGSGRAPRRAPARNGRRKGWAGGRGSLEEAGGKIFVALAVCDQEIYFPINSCSVSGHCVAIVYLAMVRISPKKGRFCDLGNTCLYNKSQAMGRAAALDTASSLSVPRTQLCLDNRGVMLVFSPDRKYKKMPLRLFRILFGKACWWEIKKNTGH